MSHIICTICKNEMLKANRSVWCETCFYGQSLVYAGRVATQDTGIAEAKFWASNEGQAISWYRSTIMQSLIPYSGSIIEAFCGCGGVVKQFRTLHQDNYHIAGYEPLKKEFMMGQEFMGTADRISSSLPELKGVDLLTVFDAFTALSRPEEIIVLVNPSTIVLECPIFYGNPQEMPFWREANPALHKRYYSEIGIDNFLESQGYTIEDIRPAFPEGKESMFGGYEFNKIVVAKQSLERATEHKHEQV